MRQFWQRGCLRVNTAADTAALQACADASAEQQHQYWHVCTNAPHFRISSCTSGSVCSNSTRTEFVCFLAQSDISQLACPACCRGNSSRRQRQRQQPGAADADNTTPPGALPCWASGWELQPCRGCIIRPPAADPPPSEQGASSRNIPPPCCVCLAGSEAAVRAAQQRISRLNGRAVPRFRVRVYAGPAWLAVARPSGRLLRYLRCSAEASSKALGCLSQPVPAR